jgi:hypothetical protein
MHTSVIKPNASLPRVWRCASTGSTSTVAELAVAFDPDTPRARYAADVLSTLLGCSFHDAAEDEEPDLVYGQGRSGRCRIPAGPQEDWDDPQPALSWDEGLAIVHQHDRPRKRDSHGVGFDALYATYACAAGVWERADPADEVGCPIGAEGWLARNGLLSEPLVHRYAECVADALGVPVPYHEPVVVLTQDVDDNFAHLFGVRESWTRLRRELRAGRPTAIRRAAGLARRALRPRRPDPNDRFDEWLQLGGERGFRPCFFVASYGLFERGASMRDVPYDIRDAEVTRTLRRLREAGAEIGLHLSLGASQDPARVRKERERLEETVGCPIRSVRHHWWALGPEPARSLRFQAEAGIVVDCSFGLNDRAGFRRGIAVPFHPFDPDSERVLPIWSLPTAAMDAAVSSRDPDEGLETLKTLYTSLRGAGGCLVLDWHVHSLNPAAMPDGAPVLLGFLEWAREQGATFATPLEVVPSSGVG